MAKVKLPAGPTDVTPGWLTHALRESGAIRGRVDGCGADRLLCRRDGEFLVGATGVGESGGVARP